MTARLDLSTNANTRWAALFLQELALAGLQDLCFAPGSRSTPLVLAAGQTPGIRLHRHLDERSAAFFALGLAKTGRRPVALVCTSGTAVANLHPAVIEAHQSRVPLIILSADRPPELRGSGANQTIDQLKLFGDHVRLFMEMPVPQDGAAQVTLRHLQTAAARTYAVAQNPVAGPVHLNFPFRKPLEPAQAQRLAAGSSSVEAAPYTEIAYGPRLATAGQCDWLAEVIATRPNGLIICGPNCPPDLAPAVATLAKLAAYPIVADPLSGVRFGPQVESGLVLGGYDLLMQAVPTAWPPVDVVLRFGDVTTSAALNQFIDRCETEAIIHVREDGVWADDLHRVRKLWAVNEAALCDAVVAKLKDRGFVRAESAWGDHLSGLEQLVWREVAGTVHEQARVTDAAAVRFVLEHLPAGALVFAGNSLPIRHVDAYAQPTVTATAVHGNRGASGIDGNVSTAIGLAVGSGRPVVAILGDITFYHDMNGLIALRDGTLPPVTFVVLNNDGGNIFRRLPVAVHEPPFTDLFLTPHGLTFEHAATLYGLDYRRIDRDGDLEGLRIPTDRSSIIEIITDGEQDWTGHQALIDRLRSAVAGQLASPPLPVKETIS